METLQSVGAKGVKRKPLSDLTNAPLLSSTSSAPSLLKPKSRPEPSAPNSSISTRIDVVSPRSSSSIGSSNLGNPSGRGTGKSSGRGDEILVTHVCKVGIAERRKKKSEDVEDSVASTCRKIKRIGSTVTKKLWKMVNRCSRRISSEGREPILQKLMHFNCLRKLSPRVI
ncbi:uncharacterized protein [Typha angustifolia]|uniref:uncharacterized protein isoform X4 n=1 Tax=Typha angustifolia TaxID=59011 RepID=UPI003C2EC715